MDVFIFKIPLQSSHMHIASTLNDNSPQWRKASALNSPISSLFQQKAKNRQACYGNKNPLFSSPHTLKTPIQKNAHLPFLCLYFAELCLGYAHVLSSLFFPQVVIYKHGQGRHTSRYSGIIKDVGRLTGNDLIMLIGSFCMTK